MKIKIGKKGLCYLSGGAALAAIVAFGCGKAKDSVVGDPTTELNNFSVSLGTVDKYESGPAYALTSIAVDESMSDSSKTTYRIASNLTEWHELTAAFSDNCSGDVTFTWDTASTPKAWIATVDHSKLSGSDSACTLTINAGMGETVPWSWVAELVSTGVDTGAKTAAGAVIKTSSCVGCHSKATTVTDSSAFGGYNLANTIAGSSSTTTSYDAFVGEKEQTTTGSSGSYTHTFADGALSHLNDSLTNYKDFNVNVTCDGASGNAPVQTSATAVKRIVKGDPAASLLVQITNATWDTDGTNVRAVNTDNGLAYKRCNTTPTPDVVAYRVMPSVTTAPIDGSSNQNTVWTKAIHTKFARWVLQGAKNE
jgi:hypothetical protein